jgi:hypothetical protein
MDSIKTVEFGYDRQTCSLDAPDVWSCSNPVNSSRRPQPSG